MSSSNLSRGRFVSGLFLVAFSLAILFLMLNQVPSLPVAGGVVRLADNSTFVETPTYVIVVETTTTTTATSLSTSMATTTLVDTTTLTHSQTETVSTTSINTSVAGVIGGLDPSMNTILLIAVLAVGAVIGAVAMYSINTSKNNTYRRRKGTAVMLEKSVVKDPKLPPDRTMGGFCGKCGKPAQNNICTGCGQPPTTCTCTPPGPVQLGQLRSQSTMG